MKSLRLIKDFVAHVALQYYAALPSGLAALWPSWLENIPHEGKPLVTLVKIPAKCLGSITFI